MHSASRLVFRALRLGLPLLLWCAARSAVASPADQPLWQVELHAGYGLAVGGNGDQMSRRPTPLTLTAIAAIAVNDDPPLAGYGGLVVETLDRNAAGLVFGVELHPHGSRLHLSGGGEYVVAPYTLWGATASGGACFHTARTVALCGDLQLTAFITGSDLPDGATATQVQLVLGMVFDAL
ncbi:MAG TPA: hypothetical protein VHW23_40175 [Kofleriaceae bacterium]|nr:hypothetical protein [Kofleriaceae bacterium]